MSYNHRDELVIEFVILILVGTGTRVVINMGMLRLHAWTKVLALPVAHTPGQSSATPQVTKLR